MSTGQTLKIRSTSLKDTLRIGAAVGQRLKGGEVIELVGDLGSGKTAFVRGLVEELGSRDKVHSPSFTLRNEYKTKSLTIFHYDFYRLSEAGIISNEMEESLNDLDSVTIIEWGDAVNDVLPSERIQITIQALDENSRMLTINGPASHVNLLQGVE